MTGGDDDDEPCPICDSDAPMNDAALAHVLEHLEARGRIERLGLAPRAVGSALLDKWRFKRPN